MNDAEVARSAARSLIDLAERQRPGNRWWGVQIARRHLEALLADSDRLAEIRKAAPASPESGLR